VTEIERRRLWVVRHPAVRPFAGAVGDLEVPIIDTVESITCKVVPRLRRLGISAIATSPRWRCREIAESLGAALAIPVRVEPRLREIDHGLWTGRSWDELEAWDAQRYRYWMAHWITSSPPGGESALALTDRVATALAQAEDRALWISHRGVVQALRVLAGMPWPQAASVPVLTLEQPGSVIELVHCSGRVLTSRETETGQRSG
jgi:alpha-ribazole phosphatase